MELPDGRLAALSQYDGVRISNDGFKTITQIVERTPFNSPTLIYSATAKAFFILHNDCGNLVLPDAVMRADFDYEAN